jgi:hypothetical protein
LKIILQNKWHAKYPLHGMKMYVCEKCAKEVLTNFQLALTFAVAIVIHNNADAA